MQLIDRDAPIEVPASVAICPICGAEVIIEDIDEWEEDSNGHWRVTESGLHLTCVTEPDIDSDEWWGWFDDHWSMPYVDWFPLRAKVWKWLDAHYRFTLGEGDE